MDTRPRLQLDRNTFTPWGAPAAAFECGRGIIEYTTASHGGYYVPPEILAQWPEPVRNAGTFAGRGWYEEDCDWSLVAVAEPDIFSPALVFEAVRMLRNYRKGDAPLMHWIQATHGEQWAQYLAENGDKFIQGGASTGGSRWSVSGYRLRDGARVLFSMPPDYSLPIHFSLAEAIARGALNIEQAQECPSPAFPLAM